MYNSLSVKYFILTARKTPALVDRLAGERQPIILAREQHFLRLFG
jgi:hypothetical protein